MQTSEIHKNILAGLMVSFIALPLCLAIATASHFPILAGIITAIVGGVIVSQISGSYVTINGPAAGMIVVVLDSIDRLGKGDDIMGYKLTIAAILVAGVCQIAVGSTKIPEILRKFPECVIRGMMTAIGCIVILRQIFTIFGYQAPRDSMVKLITDIPQAALGMQVEVFLLSMLTITFILLWNSKVKSGLMSKIPVYLAVIPLISILAYYMDIANNKHFLFPDLAKQPNSLFPQIPASINAGFTHPIFRDIFKQDFLIAVFTIFAVGSIETILSAIAIDKIDPKSRKTDLNKDLRAIGTGNAICGLIGGLPMIAEVVRSSANVKYGASNKWSNFTHGICLFGFITVFSRWVGFIPMCTLAAMLVLIGLNLINFKLIWQMYKEWKPSLIVILTVTIFTIWIDLLVGVLAGMACYNLFKKEMCKASHVVQ